MNAPKRRQPQNRAIFLLVALAFCAMPGALFPAPIGSALVIVSFVVLLIGTIPVSRPVFVRGAVA